MGLIEEEEKVEGREASMEELLLFHDKEYIETLIEADRCQCVPKGARERFNIGNYENPVSPAMYRGSSLATGSSVQAVELFLSGFIAFNPAGGMHHAFRGRANGFCFINDPVIAIEFLRKRGLREGSLHRTLMPITAMGFRVPITKAMRSMSCQSTRLPIMPFPSREAFLRRGEKEGERAST
ncbi:MAG: hypothetical protein Q9N34_07095 [Aquificota bacterium]|nr:hypothetical protein [Aquificota bacterium]